MNRKNKMTIEQADGLLKKYYEGETTTAEEKTLHLFLSQNNLPKRFDAEKAIWGYFATKKRIVVFTPLIKWAAIAAVFLGLIFIVNNRIEQKQTNYTYIDGHKSTDLQIAKKQALASLAILASADNEMDACTNSLNENNIIETQLQFFTED